MEVRIWELAGGKVGTLQERRELARQRANEPIAPAYFLGLWLIVTLVLLPLAAYPFVVERIIIHAPTWLPVSRSDFLISDYLFGVYDEEQYTNFVLLILAAAFSLGAVAGYLLVRPLVGLVHARRRISQKTFVIRGVLDLYIAFPVAIGLTSLLAWMAGVVEAESVTFGLAPLLGFMAYSGYALGSGGTKGVFGVWWHLKVGKPASGGTSSIRPQ